MFAFPQIGHFTLDNAESNAVAMQELESLLAERETAIAVGFDHLNHRVRCYAHIINICSSHVIASVTLTHKSYISDLKVPIGSNVRTRDNSDNSSDDDNNDPSHEIEEFEPGDCYGNEYNPPFKSWLAGIKRDPLRRARRIIRLLHSSDQRREGFRGFIEDGNEHSWFTAKDDNGRRAQVEVPVLQPLRDVKTRWDSVYKMLERLRELRPVRLSR
jgi:hypothetical protein